MEEELAREVSRMQLPCHEFPAAELPLTAFSRDRFQKLLGSFCMVADFAADVNSDMGNAMATEPGRQRVVSNLAD